MLECIIEEEPLQTFMHENCGIALAVHVPEASRAVRDMEWLLQNRGQAGCGICSTDGKKLHRRRAMGSVEEVFPLEYTFEHLPGNTAGGHLRYPTAGDPHEEANLHPLRFLDSNQGPIALAHNGTIPSAEAIYKKLVRQGHSFHSSTDSEVMLRIIAGSKKPLVDACIDTFNKMPTAYSLFVMTRKEAIIARDRFGVRPLSIARYKNGWLAASETDAFRAVPGARFERDVEPGEIIHWDLVSGKMKTIRYAKECHRFCVFEGHYFSKPNSFYRGIPHHYFRQKCGAQVFQENEKDFREIMGEGRAIFVPILDSGKEGSIGFTEASGMPYREYLSRERHIPHAQGRSYIATREMRDQILRWKFYLDEQRVRGKIVFLGDDSFVRGSTIRRINGMFRAAGVKKIINVSFSPMVRDICPLGMDHQDRKKLIAYECGNDELKIAKAVKADRVVYLSLQGQDDVVSRTYKCGICSGCFGGLYPPGVSSNGTCRECGS